MDDKTAVLLQKLADKFGTTTEYLWGVMVRQAHVAAITNLIQYAILGAVVYFFVRWLRSDERDYEDGVSFPVALVLGIPLLIVVFIAFFAISNTITGLANPEYWALQRVINAAK